jgi:hypothetical protein
MDSNPSTPVRGPVSDIKSASLPKVLPAEQGRCTIDEADEDVKAHSDALNGLLNQAYSTSTTHIVLLKKRLIEEKEIALMEAERAHIHATDYLQVWHMTYDIMTYDIRRQTSLLMLSCSHALMLSCCYAHYIFFSPYFTVF